MSERDEQYALVAQACQILHAQGHEHLDLGHVSARLPGGGFAVKRAGLSLGEVTTRDVIPCAADGSPMRPSRLHAELPIHVEIYASRPDVGAVVHTHAIAVGAFAALDRPFALVSQDSLPFARGVGRLADPRLITTTAMARKVVSALGAARGLIMQNHGLITVGSDIREATYLAVLLERSIRIQLMAETVGPVVTISSPEAADMQVALGDLSGRLESAWGYLVRSVNRARRAPR